MTEFKDYHEPEGDAGILPEEPITPVEPEVQPPGAEDTAAIKFFFDPEMLIAAGAPEQCAYCPALNPAVAEAEYADTVADPDMRGERRSRVPSPAQIAKLIANCPHGAIIEEVSTRKKVEPAFNHAKRSFVSVTCPAAGRTALTLTSTEVVRFYSNRTDDQRIMTDGPIVGLRIVNPGS